MASGPPMTYILRDRSGVTREPLSIGDIRWMAQKGEIEKGWTLRVVGGTRWYDAMDLAIHGIRG
ncbi:MAG: hypothetical protein MK116_06270 [Phycisphaerales bacterium]|nr:hypothetical protein [Phycisphaerales bacterium]